MDEEKLRSVLKSLVSLVEELAKITADLMEGNSRNLNRGEIPGERAKADALRANAAALREAVQKL